MNLPDLPATTARVQVGIGADGAFRWAAADFTGLVEESRRRLDLSPVAAAALGRAMTGATLLLRLSHKEPTKLVLDVQGDGPLGRILVEADSRGRVRGTVRKPRLVLPAAPDGKLPVGEAVGGGILRVRREFRRGWYESEVELVTGEIGDDLAHFLDQSEQTRAAVLLGVLARPAGVAGAGGAILEVLPGADEAIVARVESNLAELSTVSAAIATGGIEALLDSVLSDFDRRVIEATPFRLFCSCDRERIGRHLRALPADDRLALRLEDGSIAAECVFCGACYGFTESELDTEALA